MNIFGNAKIDGAIDTRFGNIYNYFVDLVSRTFLGKLNIDQSVPQVTTGTFKFPIVATTQIKSNSDSAHDLSIVTGADKTILFDTPVYNDIIIQASNLRPSGTTPPAFVVFQDSIYALQFTNAQTDIVYGAFEIPHSYKEGTDLELHIHWSPSTTNTGNCVFNFAYTFAANGGTFGAEATKTLTQAGSGVVNKHQYVSANTLISGVGIGIGSIIAFALSRPTGDAFTGDAFLHSIGIHYRSDTLGSRLISSK